jgi:phosphate transport system protein
MRKHIVESYDSELAGLIATLHDLGDAAVRQLDRAVSGLVDRDAARCRSVIDADTRLDSLHYNILRAEQEVLSRRQPVGADLRQVVAIARMSRDWERVGDHAKGIARRSLIILQDPELPVGEGVVRLHRASSQALAASLRATEEQDAELAREIWSRDDQIDEIYESLFAALLEAMQRDRTAVNAGARLLFVAKALERCGDHATNIAEEVVYWTTGDLVDAPHPRAEHP